MRINDFVENMAKRFDSKLSSTDQIKAFHEDCKIHLKQYEGEILGYAFHEIVAINGSRTHPVISKIRKICSQKMNDDHKKAHPINEENAEVLKRTKMVNDFKKTESFKWAAQHMIGVDVLIYIEKNGTIPDKEAIARMLKSHENFKQTLNDLNSIPEPSTLELMLWKTGNALNEKNLDYYHNR